MQSIDLLITHGLVVTLDDADTIIEDGAVAIRGSEIVAVGPTDSMSRQFQAADTLEAGGQLVMPGLINAHSHAGDALFRGLVDDLPLEPWLEKLWVAETTFLNPETVYLGAQLGFAEMVRGGITTAMDMFWYAAESVRAGRDLGLRLLAGPIFFDVPGPDNIKAEAREGVARDFVAEFGHEPLVTCGWMPHGTYTVSPDNLELVKRLWEEFGGFFCTHAAETAAEVATVRERYGRSPIEQLEALGLLTEQTVLAHGVHVTADEIALLAKRQTVVAHCPLSNLKLGSGIAPVPQLVAAGVPVALGTDGPVSGNDLDMWLTMRLAATLHKGVQQDPTLLPARQVVRMATVDAARALGLGDRVGSLAAGKQADVILIDLHRPHLTPRYDVYSHLVYAVGRSDVRSVIIHGRPILRDRQLLTVDEARLLARVDDLAQKIYSTRS